MSVRKQNSTKEEKIMTPERIWSVAREVCSVTMQTKIILMIQRNDLVAACNYIYGCLDSLLEDLKLSKPRHRELLEKIGIHED